MTSKKYWVYDRPLDPLTDTDIMLSRSADVEALLDNLKEARAVFVWSPPKHGTTTFFKEFELLAQSSDNKKVLLCEAIDYLSSHDLPDLPTDHLILIIDEMEKLPTIEEIHLVVQRAADLFARGAFVVLSGDNRVFKHVNELQGFSSIRQLPLNPFAFETLAQRLVIAPLKEEGYQLAVAAALYLCREAAGNPYLIQRLAESFYSNIQDTGRKEVGLTEMQGFMGNALRWIDDYFNQIAKTVLNDDNAPYEIIRLLEGKLTTKTMSLTGLGITSEDGLQFASPLFEKAFKERCAPNIFAQYFASVYEWGRAVEFYEIYLDRWCKTNRERDEILPAMMNACFAAGYPRRFTSYARQFSQVLPQEKRQEWLKETFLPNITRLLASLYEKDSGRIFETVLTAIVNVVARMGRGRLYLDDASQERLVCREAVGANEDEFKRESINIQEGRWKVVQVYLSKEFADVWDTQADEACNQRFADRMQLSSSWLFPIFAPSPSSRCIGVLCVDNPHHFGDLPEETVKKLIEDFLANVAEALSKAKSEADRNDLQFQIQHLMRLHEYLLSEVPDQDILHQLLEVATAMQKNLSCIIVRQTQGFHLNRLRIAAYWPHKELEKIFAKPSIEVVKIDDSFADPNDPQPYRFVKDVWENRQEIPALDRFLKTLEDEKVNLDLGSLLSFRLQTPLDYLGMCNFYTANPRDFLDSEILALSTIVKQTAVALYNVKQIEAIKRQRRGLEILNQCIEIINESKDAKEGQGSDNLIETVIKEVTGGIGKLFNVHSASYITIDHESQNMIVEYTWPEDEESDRGEKQIIPFGKGVTGLAVEKGGPEVLSIHDPEWDVHYFEHVPGIKCCAAIPMKDQNGKVFGVLGMEMKEDDAFTPDDINLISTVVRQVPVAIDNAIKVTELRKTREQLEQKRIMAALGESVGSTVHTVFSVARTIPMDILKIKEELSKEPLCLTPEVKKILGDIEDSSEKMRIMANLLNSATVKPKEITSVNIHDLIEKITVMIDKNGVLIHNDVNKTLFISTDRKVLTNILYCIIDNGVKASKMAIKNYKNRTPVVIIKEEKIKGDSIAIEIIDTGPGISDALVDEVCRKVVPSNFGGIGFGLFISGIQAYNLQGELMLKKECNTLNGATFRLILPKEYKLKEEAQ